MRHLLIPVLALSLLACMHLPAQTQVKTQSIDAEANSGLNRSEDIFQTPAGRTRRVEFNREIGGDLVRLEFEHLFSGRLVLGQTAVRVNDAGQWLLVNPNDNKTTDQFKPSATLGTDNCKLLSVPQGKTVLSADFSVNNVLWRAYITRIYETPKPVPGVSNESEPAVDLVVCKP